MRVAILWLGLCTACQNTDSGGETSKDNQHRPTDTGAPPVTGNTGITDTPSTWETGHPKDTGATANCDDLPTGIVPYETINIPTEEDFDFDFDGFVLYQQGQDLVGHDQSGHFKVVSPNISSDASGIQVVGSGDIVVCSPDTDVLKYVDHLTGINKQLIGGLNFPNGLEVGSGDIAYWSELSGGRIGWINTQNPAENGVVSDDVDAPNGLSLSADEQILYVAADSGGISGLLALDRVSDHEWSVPRLVLPTSASFDGVETDVCGNVYTVEYSTGRLMRVNPLTGDSVLLADLDDNGGSYAALRWGNGIGGWEKDILYVTDRHLIFAVHVGAVGTPDPVDGP
jgi:hypothetical protein